MAGGGGGGTGGARLGAVPSAEKSLIKTANVRYYFLSGIEPVGKYNECFAQCWQIAVPLAAWRDSPFLDDNTRHAVLRASVTIDCVQKRTVLAHVLHRIFAKRVYEAGKSNRSTYSIRCTWYMFGILGVSRGRVHRVM